MSKEIKIIVSVALWLLMLFIVAFCTQSCSIVRKSRQSKSFKVDSSAVSVNAYQRQTKVTETGSDSIANPVKAFVAPLNTEDTSEKTFETDVMTVKVKTGKKGHLKIEPKHDKLPVPAAKKVTEIKETGSSATAVNKTSVQKTTEFQKYASRFPWWIGLAGILVVVIFILWRFKRSTP